MAAHLLESGRSGVDANRQQHGCNSSDDRHAARVADDPRAGVPNRVRGRTAAMARGCYSIRVATRDLGIVLGVVRATTMTAALAAVLVTALAAAVGIATE